MATTGWGAYLDPWISTPGAAKQPNYTPFGSAGAPTAGDIAKSSLPKNLSNWISVPGAAKQPNYTPFGSAGAPTASQISPTSSWAAPVQSWANNLAKVFDGAAAFGGSGTGSSQSMGGNLGAAAGGGGLGSLGGLGSMMGGMGGMGGLGSLGSMLGGGGMGGIGSALGGALGGGSGGQQQPAPAPAAPEKEPDKPIPQRYWAGGYTSEQQAAMNAGGSAGNMAKLKADFDRQNIEGFKGMQGYDDLKGDRVKQAQQLAERQGGQYDTEGNYYSKGVLGGVVSDENKKRAQADANYYDTPKGAVPVAGNANDKTPAGSVPKPATGTGSGAGYGSGSGSGSTKKSGGLDNDWLKKLGGMASSWFGGR